MHMDKTYQPAELEQKWYRTWEQAGYFAPDGSGAPYCIAIPPPNVTGSLHMGHAFQHTLMDALIRYQRMRGRDALWQVGTDHAGIATQMVVERRLGQAGQSRHDLGREAFIDEVWKWKAESGGSITTQMRRLGNSVDWQRERFTMDEGFYRAVQEVFIRLHRGGLIYRGKRLVNWDPVLHTAISDLEVENHDEQGSMWHFRYPLADGSDHLVVATTRPETLLGDTAVAVHPEDERYRHLVGRQLRLPLTGRLIPVVADEHVDPEFGTGCVKVTPAHDFTDYQIGQRHGLPLVNLFDRNAAVLGQFEHLQPDGSLCGHEEAPAGLAGLDRFEARKQVVAMAEAEGWLDRIQPHALTVPRGDRSGAVIEPWLTDQWYVRVAPLAEQAIAAVEDGRIRFVPQSYENMYFAWMRNLEDWCISRQLWWGHRIPAWYDDQGQVYVGHSEEEVRQRHDLGDRPLRQDSDVLDTWFSSALWTFATLGWPDDTPELRRFHPTEVLVTGFDIIFFWVARMIMMTMHFMRDEDGQPQVPFRTVYVTGLIRDEHGQKMSKSRGNVLDPLDMIDGIGLEELVAQRTSNLMQPQLAEDIARRTRKQFPEGIAAHGTDALRFTLAALASTGRDISWDMKRLEGYRNFCNKLWNAARYVLMNTDEASRLEARPPEADLGLAERWIRSRLQRTIQDLDRHFEHYRFDRIARSIYDFVWHEYCDWYLELSKPVLYDDQSDPARRRATQATLVGVLEQILRLLHPLMPFVTEEIWQRVQPRMTGIDAPETIMKAPWPTAREAWLDPQAEADIAWLQQVVIGVRNIRGEMNLPPGQTLPVLLRGDSAEDRRRLEDNREFLKKLARLSSIDWLAEGAEAPLAATQLAGDSEVLIPLADLIDKDDELARLGRELERLQRELERTRGKLDNPRFVSRAPAEVVAAERDKLSQQESALARLEEQRERIRQL